MNGMTAGFAAALLMSLSAILARNAAVKAAYQRQLGEVIEHPAIYNDPKAVNCRGEGHLTTAAYLKHGNTTTLLTMYMSREADNVFSVTRTAVSLLPAGTIRVLALVVKYPETVGPDALALWEDAQRQINAEHAAFAKSRGYQAPIVVFENTNFFINPAQLTDPHSPAAVRAAAVKSGVSTDGYEIVMAIDLDPSHFAGGLSIMAERSVYVGNFAHWLTPLGAKEWKAVANTAYHHEVAHHWGWPGTHDWASSCGGGKPEYAPFIAPPILFGWEDLLGNHIPEILNHR